MQILLEERVATLSRIAADLVLDLPMEDTLNALAVSVVSASTAVSCLIVLVDEEADEIRLAGSYDVSDVYDKAANTSPQMEAIRSHKPVLFSNAHQTVPDNLPWEKAYFVPFLSRGKALGAIDFAYPTRPGARRRREDLPRGGGGPGRRSRRECPPPLGHPRQGRPRRAPEARPRAARLRLASPLRHRPRSRDRPRSPARKPRTRRRAARLRRQPRRGGYDLDARPHLRATPGVTREGGTRGRARKAGRRHPGTTRHTGRDRVRRRTRCAPGSKGVPLPHRPGSFAQHRQARPRNQLEDRAGTRQRGITLQISDDGVGFDANDDFPGHLGLKSMRERTSHQVGTLEITSGPAKGVRIFAHIPV